MMVGVVAATFLVHAAIAAPVQPASDDVVVERLPARIGMVRQPARDPASAAQRAQALIEQSRNTGDPRLLGHAQTVLQPWWNAPNAPADIAVLQATILQSQHDFNAARTLLARVTQQHPYHTQALLTLATVERVTGNLAAAQTACEALARAQARWLAALCMAQQQSLRGDFVQARKALATLAATPGLAPVNIAWALSLAAENEERAGDDRAAANFYQAALRMAADLYTALAYADLLLRTDQPAQVRDVLAQEPQTDAVLIRRATAAKRLQDPAWRAIAAELAHRRSQLALRDDSAAHAREAALAALWLEEDAARAWQEAQRNYALQREPLDGWLLLQAAYATGRRQTTEDALTQLRATSIADARLNTTERGA
jgi:hypothetical protein